MKFTEEEIKVAKATRDEMTRKVGDRIEFTIWVNEGFEQYSSDDDHDGMWHDPFSEGINRRYYTDQQLYDKFLND